MWDLEAFFFLLRKDLEANCKRITRNNADSFGIQLFVTFSD